VRSVLDAAGSGVEVIASGGVGSVDDLLRLREVGVAGAIVGKALYTGDVDLRAYLARAGQAAQVGGSANA
jgi:phosphoribosylformimino-5-aminoimidazole carboxamide ribotide isomerase